MDKAALPTYGVSGRYQEDAGAEYFAWQRQGADLSGSLSAKWYQPYVKAGDRVLDFGCGGGFILKHVEDVERIGVEVNPNAHAQCRANGIEIYSALSEVPGDFDMVMSNHCLEHVPYPIQAIRELGTKLKPDGKMVLILPLEDWRVQRTYRKTIDNHLYGWTPLLLGNTLVEAGLEPVNIRIFTHAFPPRFRSYYRFLPGFVFDALCTVFAVVRKRRQIVAVARRAA
jgi:SAM-dependent methyltransferase